MENKEKEYLTIDLKHIWSAVVKKIWLIILVAIIGGGAALSYATFWVAPKYESSIMFYVNNKNLGNQNGSGGVTSSSDLVASQYLVKTYRVLLMDRVALQKVVDEGNLPYDYKELSNMIKAESVDGTEVMRVTVTSSDPYEAAEIANYIADVLPNQIKEVIEGAEPKSTGEAVPNLQKISPSRTNYTLIGAFIGVLLAGAIVVISAIMDDTIHDEEYIIQTYHYPILAKVPDLMSGRSKGYGYYQEKPANADEQKGV